MESNVCETCPFPLVNNQDHLATEADMSSFLQSNRPGQVVKITRCHSLRLFEGL